MPDPKRAKPVARTYAASAYAQWRTQRDAPKPPPDEIETKMRGGGGEIVKDVLSGALEAARIANAGDLADLPDGWTTVDPPAKLATAFARAGAMQLVSPSGTAYLAFAEHEPSRFEKLQQRLGIKTDRTRAAFDIGREFSSDAHVTFAGSGRGGALAKLAAETASARLGGNEGVETKLCVAINSKAVAPRTYAAFGLATKNHERTTCHLVNEADARDRLKGFERVQDDAYMRSLGESDDAIAKFKSKEVYRVERRANARYAGGGRAGVDREEPEDVRITIKGKLSVNRLFKDGDRDMGRFSSPTDMPRDMRATMVRNYVRSQREHKAVAHGMDGASRSDDSSLGR